MLAEAACELFLERGFEQTTLADISSRAGVSRSSFFNYFSSKADVLWAGLDERLTAVSVLLDAPGTGATIGEIVKSVADGFEPDSLALAIGHADAMGIATELARERAVRQLHLADRIARRLRRDGSDRLVAEVHAAAFAGAVFAAVWAWALSGPGQAGLSETLADALAAVPG